MIHVRLRIEKLISAYGGFTAIAVFFLFFLYLAREFSACEWELALGTINVIP